MTQKLYQCLYKTNSHAIGVCNTNTYRLNKGILKYGVKGKQALNKELTQLHHSRRVRK